MTTSSTPVSTQHTDSPLGDGTAATQPRKVESRRGAETKASFKTTELILYVGAVTAVVVTAFIVGGNDQGSPDPFGAAEALRYITWLTIGYMVARGLAKSGSHHRDHS
jgi:hypothetical protein